MLRYEVLFLTLPEITADERGKIEKGFEELVSQAKGNVISFDRWGKYKLAYPVRDREYGVYFLVRFEVDKANASDLLKAVNLFFAVRNEDIVARHMVSVLDVKRPLEYARPESLEDVPTKDVDTFLKENKMSGLIKGSGKDRHAAEEAHMGQE